MLLQPGQGNFALDFKQYPPSGESLDLFAAPPLVQRSVTKSLQLLPSAIFKTRVQASAEIGRGHEICTLFRETC